MKKISSMALALLACACVLPNAIKDPSAIGARFSRSERMVFAFELKPICKLQMYDGPGAAPAKAWKDVSASVLANKTFKILERTTMLSSEKFQKVVSQGYRLEGAAGEVVWIRNVPEKSTAEAMNDWACAFDAAPVAGIMPKLSAPVVRLSAASTECSSITPIFGGVDAVTFAPYTVTATSLFSQNGKGVVGVRLEADGGEKAITIPADALDRCFVAADRAPPPPREATALRTWLDGSSDTEPPPAVSHDTVEQLTALQLDRCMREGSGVLTHHECRTPILRIIDSKEKGPYGPSIIRFVRERVVDALHLYAGHLVPAADIVTANVAVRLARGTSDSFDRSFQEALERSLTDPKMRVRRASNGFRLLRVADVSAGVPATHHVDIELSYAIPDVVATTERRVHKYVAGKKTIHNPKFDEASQELARAEEALASAKRAAAFIEEAAEIAAKRAGDACKDGASKAGAFGSMLSGALCKSATKAVGGAAERLALSAAEKRLAAAQAKIGQTPETIETDDTREHAYVAKVYRRSGDAAAKISIGPVSPVGRGEARSTTAAKFHFEASDDEVAASPEHKLDAKVARVPTVADVERKLSTNMLERIDEAIVRWGAQHQIGGDIGELQPGTRSWMAAVARHAASDRNVKLLSDLLENRENAGENGHVDYPIKLPKELARRCFVFAAIPMDPMANVDLVLGKVDRGQFAPVVVDRRATPEAAFEICDLPTNAAFAARVSALDKKAFAKGVLVSMFESTANAATPETTIAASRGIPTMGRKGEALVLNGEGLVEFRGTNNQVVVGRTGDRDGDGIPDDEDRCPYDPETPNGYLDDDGCPDVAPTTPAQDGAR